MIDLNGYQAIQTAQFCRVDVPGYAVLRFSDFQLPYIISGETYQPLGKLLSMSSTTSNLRAVSGDMSITISGIPNSSIAEFLDNRIRGSEVSIYRGLFSAATGQALAITGNPFGRFQGIVSNYLVEEQFSSQDQTATSTITMQCTSVQELLSNRIAGRATNGADQTRFYPTDQSMDRVISLTRSNLNWGAP